MIGDGFRLNGFGLDGDGELISGLRPMDLGLMGMDIIIVIIIIINYYYYYYYCY